jgi:hypothetical protein
VLLESGASRFLKIADEGQNATWLRAEYRVYSQLDASFLPRLLGWDDDGNRPILVLEDLSEAYWPPPWQPGQIEAVVRTLDLVHATRLKLQKIGAVVPGRRFGWEEVAKDPLNLLSVGVCSGAWLNEVLPTLRVAAREAPFQGDDLVHLDVRSDNVCFLGKRAIFVDWNWAAQGNGLLDLAFWAPTLAAEGGPAPDELLPEAPAWAALVSGFVAAGAGMTPLRDAARVQAVQIQQLRSALAWVARALELPSPDGH